MIQSRTGLEKFISVSAIRARRKMNILDELFTEVHTLEEVPKTLNEDETVGGTPPEVQQWQPSQQQYSPIVNTLDYVNAVVPSNPEPRVTSAPSLPYAYSQAETQTLNVSDQSQINRIHPSNPLQLGTVASASHLADCRCKCTQNNMSPERDTVLRHQYIDLLWELHELATAGALSGAEYHLQKGIILGRMSAL